MSGGASRVRDRGCVSSPYRPLRVAQAQVAEVAAVSSHFAAPAGLVATGATIAGVKYMFVRGEENEVIQCKKVSTIAHARFRRRPRPKPQAVPTHALPPSAPPPPRRLAAPPPLPARPPSHVALLMRRASGRGGRVLLPLQHLHHRRPPQRQGPARQLPRHGGQARRLPQGAGHLDAGGDPVCVKLSRCGCTRSWL